MRKFALSSAVYHRYKLPHAIRRTAIAGYSGVEIIADAPHGYPFLLTQPDRKAIRSTLAQNRLAISNINAAPMTALRDHIRPSWIEADPVLRQERINHTLDAGQLAKDLGAPTISTLPGGIQQTHPPVTPSNNTEHDHTIDRFTALNYLVTGLKQVLAAVAKDKCPPLLIDPQPGLLIQSTADALELLKLIPSPHIGISLNTANFHRAAQNIPDAIRQLDKAIRHVQIQDVAQDPAATAVPGTGLIDFHAVFAALDAINYQGWLTIDLAGADAHPDEAAKQALEFLRQF